MSAIEKWLLKRLLRRAIAQGGWRSIIGPQLRIEFLYQMIRTACREEYREDNAATTDAFLRERFERTQYTPSAQVNAPLAPEK